MASSLENRRPLLKKCIDPQHTPTIARQCELLGLARSTYYHEPQPESAENLRLMRRIDELYLKRPFSGSRKMAAELEVNRKRVQRLMRLMGIEAHYPKPNLSRPAPGHQVYPYLLRGVEITRANHVWSTDITYLPMHGGFLYLVAVMDWFSRFALSWELSNTLDGAFCSAALAAAFGFGQPEIWNSDQGSQFTARPSNNAASRSAWTAAPGDFAGGAALHAALEKYFHFYNFERPHQALGYQTPAELFPLRNKRKGSC
jgi:putative transposase